MSGHDLPEGAQTSEPSDILALRQALDLLNSNDRNILILREYLEMSYGDISRILDLGEGSVKSRLFYARKRLKEILEAAT